jgi:hypothetical protein
MNGAKAALGGVALLALAAAVAQRHKPAPRRGGSAAKTSILTQMRNGELQPITGENLKGTGRKRFSIKEYARKTDQLNDLIESLQDEIKEESGHYGRKEDAFQFYIKASGAFLSIPEWVTGEIDDEIARSILDDYAQEGISELIREIKDDSSGMYQSWFTGTREIAGRGGGYLLLGYDLDRTMDDVLQIELDDLIASTPLGIKRIVESEVTEELERLINEIIVGLAQRDRLEAYIRELVKEFDTNFDEDFWRETIENMGYDVPEGARNTRRTSMRRRDARGNRG